MLFIVPCPAAGTIKGAAFANAPKTTSTKRIEVSTLPAATAAGLNGFKIDPWRVLILIFRNKPWHAGACEGIEGRYDYAIMTTAIQFDAHGDDCPEREKRTASESWVRVFMTNPEADSDER